MDSCFREPAEATRHVSANRQYKPESLASTFILLEAYVPVCNNCLCPVGGVNVFPKSKLAESRGPGAL